MRKLIVGATAIILFIIACSGLKRSLEFPKSFTFSVENTAGLDRTDEVIFLNVAEVKRVHPDFNPNAFIVLDKGKELPSQADDLDGDGQADQVVFSANVEAKESNVFTLRYAQDGAISRVYPKRTQAELSHKFGGQFVNRKYEGGAFKNVQSLRVPPEHTDHSFYIRYEGPGWESDKVGYRFYLDWRNAIDVYGKKIPDLVLQDVGQDGFDSYHEMSDWGMDILKVGEALGLGSIGMWVNGHAERVSVTDSTNCTIVANGPVYSQIRTDYFGWKVASGAYHLNSDLSITAGSRLTRHTVQVDGIPPNLCTGIVKLENTQFLSATRQDGEWMALATYGIQSLAEDKLGMAVLFRKSDLIELNEDAYSHVIVLKPQSGSLTYYFLAAWEQEPNGIQTEKEFMEYLNETVEKIDNPLTPEL